MPKRTLPALLGVGAALAVPVARPARRTSTRRTRPRTGPAAPPRPSTASPPARRATSCARAATPSTRRSPRPPCSASPSRTRRASAAAASWSSAARTARSRRSTRARRRPRAMQPRLVHRERRAAGVQRRALQRPLGRRARHRRRLGRGAAQRYGTWTFKRALAPAIDVAREGFVVDADLHRPDRAERPVVRRHPRHGGALPRPGRHRARPRLRGQRNPDMAARLRADRPHGARSAASTAARSPRRWSAPRGGRRTAADRRPDVAARADARSTTCALPRARCASRPASATAASTSSAWARRPRAARPSARRSTSSSGSRATGDARRPRSCTASSRPRASRSPTATSSSPTRRSSTSRCAGCSPTASRPSARALIGPTDRTRRRPGRRPERQPRHDEDARRRSSRRPSRPRTSPSPTARARSSATRSRSSRPAATASSCPGWGFLLNNELTDFNYDNPAHPNAPGRRQAAALVDGADLRRARRAPAARGRLARRRDDHHHGAPDPHGADRLRKTLPQAIAEPRASQRNPAATATNPNSPTAPEAAFLERWGPALQARGHTFSAAAEIGAATGIEFLPGGRMLAAAEPVRRGGGSAAGRQAVAAQSARTGSTARTSSTTASAPASASAPNGPVAIAITRTRSARAQAMSRGVSPITTVRSRAQPPARARAIAGSSPRSSASEPKPPWPGAKWCADPGGRELAPRDRLEVAGHERLAVDRGIGGERGQRLRHAGRDESGEVGGAELVVGGDRAGEDLVRAGVDRGVVDPGPAQEVARDRGVGATRGLDHDPVELDAVHRGRRAPQCRRMLARGAQQQRAVDVPEEEKRG